MLENFSLQIPDDLRYNLVNVSERIFKEVLEFNDRAVECVPSNTRE